MKEKIYVVIDTNVIVSALLSRNLYSSTVQVINSVFDRTIIPLYNEDIIDEYINVLRREKFHFEESYIEGVVNAIKSIGIPTDRTKYNEEMPDPKDRVFYEVSLTGDSYLVTGNKKHFPQTPMVVTPAEMMAIINE